jgi:mandelate racemase
MKHPGLTLRAVETRAVNVPMRRPLGTSAVGMAMAPFVLVDVVTEEGVTGRAHVFCYVDIAAPLIRRVLAMMGEILAGSPVDPQEISQLGRNRFALVGTPGVIGMALSALDVACWDAIAKAAGVPLAQYLGATVDTVPAYNSNGLSLTDPDGLQDEALELLASGFEAVKIRLGRRDAADDLRAVQNVRAAIPTETALMADYNQALRVEDAIERGQALENDGLEWIEEPIAHDNLVGCARVAAALETPIQAGENFAGPATLASAIQLTALDFAMLDLMRIGGVSGWLEAAELAANAGLPLSSHLYPEVSIHLLAASPSVHWLEYVDWAEPFLATGVSVVAGQASVPSAPGTGVDWDEEAVERYSAS